MRAPHDGRLDVLVADDDPEVVAVIEAALRAHDHAVRSVADGCDAVVELGVSDYDLAIVDLRLPSADGFEVLRAAHASGRAIDVIVMSGPGSITEAVAAIKMRAVDYLAKPLDTGRLIEAVGDVAQRRAVLAVASRDAAVVNGLIGESRMMVQVRERLVTFADSDAPVLILGDSGTGKELAARLIHDRSPRRSAPFVAVNCAAFPDSLIESEMFGHVRGAFSGAVRDRPGRIAAAHGGTLFLDEVADLTLPAQAKLLRVLEDGSYSRVGSNTPEYADVRIVSATNQNLARAIVTGRFREDLYYRLRVLDVRLPTLSERAGDLALLIEHFLCRHAVGRVPRMTPRAWAALYHHSFPGNVRELEHVIRRAVALARGQDIRVEHLPDDLHGAALPEDADGATELGVAVERFEREFIRHALRETHGNRGRAAESLGISRKHLWHKMRAYQLTDTDLADPS